MRFSGVLYQREAVVFFQETVLRAWKEVDDALTAYREAQHPRADLGRSVTEDQAALQAATERYSEGAIDFLNIVTTQAQLLQSENDLAVEAAVAGAPPILLHGALSDYRNWQPQIAEFSVVEDVSTSRAAPPQHEATLFQEEFEPAALPG